MLKTALRYFGGVAQMGSIRAAAEALNVAQSAVSRQIQTLEREFGGPLFERRARGIALTPTGEALYRYYRDASFQVERVRSEIDAIQGLRRGRVNVYCLESLVPHVMPRAVERFRGKYPGVTFKIFTAPSNEIAHAVRDGAAEIGVAFNSPATPEIKVAFRKVEALLAVMRPEHRLAKTRSLSLSQIAGWPVALQRHASGSRQLIDAACAKAGVDLAAAIETNSMDLLYRFAVSGQGVAFLSRLTCFQAIQAGELVGKKLADTILNSGAIEILTLASRSLPLAAEEFLTVLRREIEQLPIV